MQVKKKTVEKDCLWGENDSVGGEGAGVVLIFCKTGDAAVLFFFFVGAHTGSAKNRERIDYSCVVFI